MGSRRELERFLGGSFELTPLKSASTRLRNALKPWLIPLPRRPMVYRVTTDDGRRYKLLRCGRSDRPVLQHNDETLTRLAHLASVPDKIFRHGDWLLVEYVEGHPPELADPHFAELLGAAFAQLHAEGPGERSREDVAGEIHGHAEALARAGRLAADRVAQIDRLLADELPPVLPTGTVYTDQKVDNFLITPEGSLVMFDVGAFTSDMLVDLMLMGGRLYGQIARDRFRAAYLETGGDDFMFRCAHLLRVVFLTRRSRRDLDTARHSGRIYRRRRALRLRAMESQLADLERGLSGGWSDAAAPGESGGG